MTASHILILGTSATDTKGRAAGPILPGTPNPGDIRISVGGVARNIAENLARLGLPTLLRLCSENDE
ncbi:MAG: hypothetical protein H8E35_14505 [Ardenticatenia bacterium]|nr:hypothetical protein [Ardenticatenia bacterium]